MSHCRIESLRRTVLNTCGRSRTWQIVQMPSRASATATPLRLRATGSNVREHLLVERGDQRRALGGDPLERRLHLDVLGAAVVLRSASTAFCLGGELALPPS